MWRQPDVKGGKPRFVFVRRGSVLEVELRRRYPAAALRLPSEIGGHEAQ